MIFFIVFSLRIEEVSLARDVCLCSDHGGLALIGFRRNPRFARLFDFLLNQWEGDSAENGLFSMNLEKSRYFCYDTKAGGIGI
jgi:hypothetical protein